jgi:DNA-binding FrmR family transcriptional regulator
MTRALKTSDLLAVVALLKTQLATVEGALEADAPPRDILGQVPMIRQIAKEVTTGLLEREIEQLLAAKTETERRDKASALVQDLRSYLR